ncbi:class F sortase [Bailinhaonella thermotolerans]|uniref:Class F sortase n=1 Tax=Bailinhaonella thermotolerans TaxID=1070861 RepID=A0A3A4A9I6_9ACTN|nr:class F sortase [Bailinhaonella thermotolerans]RJL23567.1 class F sortase [Bailinhaonella thermotolerans]
MVALLRGPKTAGARNVSKKAGPGSPGLARIAVAALVSGGLLWAVTSGPDTLDAPPVAPERLEIPSLKVDAELMLLGFDDEGDIELPPYEKPEVAGWFEHSVVPGDKGASVIIGHVDTRTEPAVFYDLKRVKKGASLRITRSDGKVASYRVESVESVDKDRFPVEKVYSAPGLRLVTCGGGFDRARHEYKENVIVYAKLTGLTPAAG